MKLNKIFFGSALAALAAVAGTGCKKSVFDVNKNPNQATDSTITYNYILPAAISNTATVVATNWGWIENWMGQWARSGTYAPNTQEETYTLTNSFETSVWDNLYANTYNYEVMRRKAAAANAMFYEGVGRIMKAHNFALLVDFYNDVPYKEAFQGNANKTPHYDKGIDIYKDLFRQIDTGITNVRAGFAAGNSKNIDFATNDLIYAGDSAKWVRFANTLKLRMLVHLMNGGVSGHPQSVVPGIDIPGEFAKISASVASGVNPFMVEGGTAQINPGYLASKPNPFYRLYVKDEGGVTTGSSVYYKANSYAINYYEYNGDPREDKFYIAPGTSHKGVAYGLPPTAENAAANLSSIGGPGVLPSAATSPAWILTSFESLFLQAEAIQRGFLTGSSSAAVMYKRAVTESFVRLGLTAANATSYLANNGTSPDVYFPTDPLYAIISQKWFALNSFAPYEIYTDWRRTDIVYGADAGFTPGPPISQAPQLSGNTNVKIPVRLFYPQTEYSYNAGNVPTGASITPTTRVFWDLQ